MVFMRVLQRVGIELTKRTNKPSLFATRHGANQVELFIRMLIAEAVLKKLVPFHCYLRILYSFICKTNCIMVQLIVHLLKLKLADKGYNYLNVIYFETEPASISQHH